MSKSSTRLLLGFWAFSFLLSGLAFAQGAPAGGVRLQENAPDRYVVEKGDTLWSIAGRFLKDPWKWPEIWHLNQEQVRNPNRIFPGDIIVLDRSKNPPQLALEQPSVKLGPRTYETPVAQAIPAIPSSAIEPFLTQPLVIEPNGLENAPRIVATQENRVYLGPGGVAYVSGLGSSAQPSWQVFRPGRPLVDPDSQKAVGTEAVYLGTVRVVRTGEPATVQIVSAAQEISTGDRLIAVATPSVLQYVPHAPTSTVQARIIGLYDSLPTSEGGRTSVISLNKGRRDGLESGHVLAIYRAGATVSTAQGAPGPQKAATSITLPDERYGLVFVFRVFDSVSYALVMSSSRPVAPGDRLQNP